MAFFYIIPNLIKIKKFQEQLIILKVTMMVISLPKDILALDLCTEKKSFNFLCWNGQECNTFFHDENWKSIFTNLAY